MFYKAIESTAKRLKYAETDISYGPYENLLEIGETPKMVPKGKRVFYEFARPSYTFLKNIVPYL